MNFVFVGLPFCPELLNPSSLVQPCLFRAGQVAEISAIKHHLWKGWDDNNQGKHTRRLGRACHALPANVRAGKIRPHRPLKVGIAVDIVERCPELYRRKLGVALAAYTRRVMYLKGMYAIQAGNEESNQ